MDCSAIHRDYADDDACYDEDAQNIIVEGVGAIIQTKDTDLRLHSAVTDLRLHSAVTPCCCSMLGALGRVVSIEACCQWALLSVKIIRHYLSI